MERKDLVIVGAGGLGREVMWQLSEMKDTHERYNILGFVDDAPDLVGKVFNHYPVVGNNRWLIDYPKEICAVLCVANTKIRKKIYDSIKVNSNICYPNIISDSVKYSEFVQFGKGCVICISSTLTVNIEIGDFVILNPCCAIGHDVIMEDYVTLYPSVNVSGNVRIGAYSEIGTGSQIIQGKNIGEHAIIGAGAVVVKDIPPSCTAVGVPAKPIQYHES